VVVKEVQGEVGPSAVGDEGDVFDAEVGKERDDGFLEDEEAGGEGDGRRATEPRSEWLISSVVKVVELHLKRKRGRNVKSKRKVVIRGFKEVKIERLTYL
jgi:hypothetical protein